MFNTSTFYKIYDKLFMNNFLDIIVHGINKKKINLTNKKPITPSDAELKLNPPSRSAKLRFAIKTSHNNNFEEFIGKFKKLTDIEELKFDK